MIWESITIRYPTRITSGAQYGPGSGSAILLNHRVHLTLDPENRGPVPLITLWAEVCKQTGLRMK